MVRLYDLHTEEETIQAWQFVVPFRFAGTLFPAGSWIALDIRAGRRQGILDEAFRALEAEFGESAIAAQQALSLLDLAKRVALRPLSRYRGR